MQVFENKKLSLPEISKAKTLSLPEIYTSYVSVFIVLCFPAFSHRKNLHSIPKTVT